MRLEEGRESARKRRKGVEGGKGERRRKGSVKEKEGEGRGRKERGWEKDGRKKEER